MTVFNEGRAPAGFLLSEASGQRSREAITIASGAGVLAAGTVLGKITASGKYLSSAIGAADGSEAAAAVLLYPVDATSADVEVAAIVRDAEVNGNLLAYAADRDQAAEKLAAQAELAAVGIITRS